MSFKPETFYKKEISKFEKKYSNLITTQKPKSLYEPCNYIVKSGGKRLRPFLVMLSALAVNSKISSVTNAAIAVELLHNFTLAHDDIMDNADKRRGRTTLHIKYNTNTAILAGDNLIAMAYKSLLKDCKHSTNDVVNDFTQGIIEVCEGQSLDTDFEIREKVSKEEYLIMIQKKTAALAETCCSIGARLGGGSTQEISALRKYGRYLGLAFQIQDDILDVMANEKELGKKIGGDLIEGKKTYLLLSALDKAKGNDKKILQKVIANKGIKSNQVNTYRKLFLKLGVIDDASKQVNKYTDMALAQLKRIKNEQAKTSLVWLANYLTNRKK
ncbi:MAG: polyprenyl synthetase family protein [Melioribacteraceae bacterium]